MGLTRISATLKEQFTENSLSDEIRKVELYPNECVFQFSLLVWSWSLDSENNSSYGPEHEGLRG
jgi:hypothetical protein